MKCKYILLSLFSFLQAVWKLSSNRFVLGDGISIQYGEYLQSFLECSFRYENNTKRVPQTLNNAKPCDALLKWQVLRRASPI